MKKRLAINNRSIELWKDDTAQSVDFYNRWFMDFAPATFINARRTAMEKVGSALNSSETFCQLTVKTILDNPAILEVLRMATTPPIALDRLAGLSGVSRGIIERLESGKRPARMTDAQLAECAETVVSVIARLLDKDLMPWIERGSYPKEMDRLIATTVIADRLCGSLSNPIIRNEQEGRQLRTIQSFLESLGYEKVDSESFETVKDMPNGSFGFHVNVPVRLQGRKMVNIPVDVVIKRKNAKEGEMPVLIECKSAGDFANTNKRRKEEAVKVSQLRATYGKDVEFVLFLCGYFDSGYLGYEAAEGIDWIWEHRVDDLLKLDLQ